MISTDKYSISLKVTSLVWNGINSTFFSSHHEHDANVTPGLFRAMMLFINSYEAVAAEYELLTFHTPLSLVISRVTIISVVSVLSAFSTIFSGSSTVKITLTLPLLLFETIEPASIL